MAAPKESTSNSSVSDNRQSSCANSKLAELEKGLLACFESMIEKQIELLNQDIQQIRKDQKASVINRTFDNEGPITANFKRMMRNTINYKISYVEDQLLEKNIIFQGIAEAEYEDTNDIQKKL